MTSETLVIDYTDALVAAIVGDGPADKAATRLARCAALTADKGLRSKPMPERVATLVRWSIGGIRVTPERAERLTAIMTMALHIAEDSAGLDPWERVQLLAAFQVLSLPSGALGVPHSQARSAVKTLTGKAPKRGLRFPPGADLDTLLTMHLAA